MKFITKLAAAAVGVGVGVVVRQVRRSRARPEADASREPRSRWRAVTVNKPASEVAPDGALPPPLAELGDAVEVRITAASDGKGTELSARLRDGEPSAAARLVGRDRRQDVRSALRRSKQLIEVGEVLRVDPQSAGYRPPTPAGKVLEAVTRRAGGEGVL
jgi:hypothetical protein